MPFNLLFCLGSLVIAYVLLTTVGLTEGQSIVLSLLMYLNEVRHECQYDWLNDKKADKI